METDTTVMRVVCSYCKKVNQSRNAGEPRNPDPYQEVWAAEELPKGTEISHGTCPACFDREMGHLKKP